MKLSKGFKCPKPIKTWGGLDREERRILMKAHEVYLVNHKESLKRKDRGDRGVTGTGTTGRQKSESADVAPD